MWTNTSPRFLGIVLLLFAAVVNLRIIDLDDLYANDQTSDGQLYSQLYNHTQEWGTYKANLFFGMKDRSPVPVDIGMVWIFPTTNISNPMYNKGYIVRNSYTDIDIDGVMAYWEFHDGWSSARQVI